MARLLCIRGQFEGQIFDIDRGLTLGRAPHNTVTLDKTRGVSRDHAKVWRLGLGQFAVADVGSTNGTLVNDDRTERGDLSDGDMIQVGEAIFRFELTDEDRPKKIEVPAAAGGSRDDMAAAFRGDGGAAGEGGGEPGPTFVVKERVLQYNRKAEKGSQLGWDITQLAGAQRWAIYAIALAACAALFYVVSGAF